ncbi:HupE/UreJ family protein [Azoarcus sp. L1K30]|uniref:HupE/UreJ family protein n=1 Tax=Azoarcus sp. L1K30 TaxID=2820277 RepID=UPI001B80F8E2|nr:HupE/UreJ family protein [Azoarcus sp. L1K30]MBR0566856.1 HupE/UreJ family protein [Azoarcus sp. L1K30]
MKALLATLVALIALASSPAYSHELSMAELEVRETAAGTFVTTWLASGNVPPGQELTPIWPKGCSSQDEQVQCGSGGMSGMLKMEGIGQSYSAALIKVYWRDGSLHVYPLTAAQPSARLLDTTSGSVADTAIAYANLGIEHILLGVDHLLFVLGLLLIVGNRWMLLKTITAFTVAHSITLAIATFGVAHVAPAPLNAAIALSILFLGPEVVRCWRGETSFTIRHPWIVAFAFGLLHGFGFASGLAELGLSRDQIPLALLMFNVGVEIGQLGFVLCILLLFRSLRLLAFERSSVAERLPGYLVGTLGAFWTIQRVFILLKGIA